MSARSELDGRQHDETPRHRGWTVPQRHAVFVEIDPGSPVAGKDLPKSHPELSPEMVHSFVVRPKLLPHGLPRDEGRPLRVNPVQPLCKPAVKVK